MVCHSLCWRTIVFQSKYDEIKGVGTAIQKGVEGSILSACLGALLSVSIVKREEGRGTKI
jgi:hypothetical protein